MLSRAIFSLAVYVCSFFLKRKVYVWHLFQSYNILPFIIYLFYEVALRYVYQFILGEKLCRKWSCEQILWIKVFL